MQKLDPRRMLWLKFHKYVDLPQFKGSEQSPKDIAEYKRQYIYVINQLIEESVKKATDIYDFVNPNV